MSISEKQTRAEGTEERQTSLVKEGAHREMQRERESERDPGGGRDLIYRHFKNCNFIRICSSPSLKGSPADR